jgi:hypothetical protein
MVEIPRRQRRRRRMRVKNGFASFFCLGPLWVSTYNPQRNESYDLFVVFYSHSEESRFE